VSLCLVLSALVLGGCASSAAAQPGSLPSAVGLGVPRRALAPGQPASPVPEGSAPGRGDELLLYAPEPPRRRFPLEASWDNGLRFGSEDQLFHVHVGGNAQVDSNWLIAPEGVFAIPGGGENGVGNAAATLVRRARLRMDGDLFDQFDYIVEYDFSHAENEDSGIQPNSYQNIAGSPVPCNIWMQIREVPWLGNGGIPPAPNP
jgi:hypothetical protein